MSLRIYLVISDKESGSNSREPAFIEYNFYVDASLEKTIAAAGALLALPNPSDPLPEEI